MLRAARAEVGRIRGIQIDNGAGLALHTDREGREPMSTYSILSRIAALPLVLLAAASALYAQSGRGVMRGYVDFEEVSYNDLPASGVVGRVQLRSMASGAHTLLTVQTNEHGLFEIPSVPMGEYTLRISAPGYRTYSIQTYIPSDFVGNLAVRLKRAANRAHGARR